MRRLRSSAHWIAVAALVAACSGDGSPGGDGGVAARCSHRCGPGEACVGKVCSAVSLSCLVPCAPGQLCADGQCVDTLPGSCTASCAAGTTCVRGGCLPDRDGDGIPDAFDLCPNTPGVAQTDGDGDRIGDHCDGRPAVADLVSRGGGLVTAAARERTGGFRVLGTLGSWATPIVVRTGPTRVRSGPTALGGATNRPPAP